MSSIISAGAIALNIAGAFTPGQLPPEPPALEHPHAHAAWAKIANMRQIKPNLERHNGVFHKPIIKNSGTAASSAVSSNWSGSAIVGSPGQYSTAATAMSVLVPNTYGAFGSCNNNIGYTAAWNGIDGFGNTTVEQSGIQIISTSNCSLSDEIYAWIETYPNPEIAISNFQISPGDMVDIWTWINPTLTCAAYENESKQTYTSVCVNDPVSVEASTAEWVVERPEVSGSLAMLGNYVVIPIWSAFAWEYQKNTTFGAAAAPPQNWGSSGTLYSIDMIDNPGNVISHPNARWYDTLLMYDMSDAYCQTGANCAPRN